MSINIESALLNAGPLSELTDRQVSDFRNRLDFIASIKLRYDKNIRAGATTQKILDDLELDVAVNLAMPSEDQSELTAFFTHTSWRIDAGSEGLTDLLDDNVREHIFRAHIVPVDSSSFRASVEQELATLEDLISAIEVAGEFDGFMATLIGIDCILARLLHFSYTMRLLALGC